jgi:hypothetical protein
MSTKFKILAIMLALVLIPLTASATMTRVIGLGGRGAAFVIKDSSNPVEFPSTLAYYPRLLYAEFAEDCGTGTPYLDRVGAWYGFGDHKCVLGFDIFQHNREGYMGMPEIPSGDYKIPPRLNLRWARPFDGFTLGAALGIYHEDYSEGKKPDPNNPGKYIDSKLEQKSTVFGLDLGVTALDNLLDASLGFEMPTWTNKNADGKELTKNDGSIMFYLAGRYWYNYGEKVSLVPNIEFKMKKDGYTAIDTSGTSATTTAFRLGVGHNWMPADNVFVLFDLGVQFKSTKNEWERAGVSSKTDSKTYLPYWRIGWEGGVFKWLTVRAGAQKTWLNTKEETDPLEPETSPTPTKMYFGGDFNFGPLNIQYLMDQGFLLRGPNFLSGTSGDLFHRVSLVYQIPKF